MKKANGTLAEELGRLGLSAMLNEEDNSEGIDGNKITAPINEEEDPFDGKYVTEAMLDRINALPMEAMEESDLDSLIESFRTKVLSEDASEDLAELADKTVQFITEAKADMIMRRKDLSRGKKKEFLCKKGFRKLPGAGPDSHICVPSFRAVGSRGKLIRQAFKKSKYSAGARGKKSKRKSAKFEEGTVFERNLSPLANELLSLVEDSSTEHHNESVRDELVSRMVDIIEMLSEEFNDKDVIEVYEESIESMLDSYEIGRLDEDVMDESEFLSELAPVINLIRESYRKIADGEDLGN